MSDLSQLTVDKAAVDNAISAFRQGRFVLIVDDEDRENEGDLAIAADHVTPEAMNFMATHGKGLICLAMRGALLDRLNIPLMVPTEQNRSGFGTGFTVSIEAASGVSTGISAHDRSHTIKTLIDPATTPNDIAMPGHMFPVRARDGGVLERRGQTEASVDLSILAGLTPAASICEVMSADGQMARQPELIEFSNTHGIPIVSVDALASYRRHTESNHSTRALEEPAIPELTKIGTCALPTKHGMFESIVYRDPQGNEHVALVHGKAGSETGANIPMVRIHSECMTGDAFGSLRCDCGQQLENSLEKIVEDGCGVMIYLRQEGRGIGLGNKIRAYELQDQGLDTVDANEKLGFPADARKYDVAARILGDLGIPAVRLITNNPQKTQSLEKLGITVSAQLPLITESQQYNERYLSTKKNRMGHRLTQANDDDDISDEASSLLHKNTGKLDCRGVTEYPIAQDV